MSTITETISISTGAIASVVFSNADGTIGIEVAATGKSIVAPGTALNNTSSGVWSYTFTDPAPGLVYNYWIQVTTTAGTIIRFERQLISLWSSGSNLGQTDALALAVVDWLVANSGSFSLAINPQRRFRLLDELSGVPTINQPANVDVFPDVEVSERQGMSTAFASTYAIHLFIQQQVNGGTSEDAQCALLTSLRSQIVESLKLRMFSLPNAVHPVSGLFLKHIKSADRGLYNLDRLLHDHVYQSDTVLLFRASV